MHINYFLALALLATFCVTAAENLSDHEEYCQTQPEQPCLTYIRQSLSVVPENSGSWFKIKSYELDYLYDKREFSELLQQTGQLLHLTQLPESFALQLYFYHAKMLFVHQNTEQANYFANLALTKLQSAYASFGTPIRLIELANLHYSLNEFSKADTLLNDAANQFKNSKDPLFWFEWYANKALIADNMNELKMAAQLRQQALQTALQMGHKSKIIVAYGNLARTQQLLQQYELAYQYYRLSLDYMSGGTDDFTRASHVLRMAEVSWQAGDYSTAALHLKTVNAGLLQPYHRSVWQDLMRKPELSSLIAQPDTP
jgi:tetratricopeptide (TPR) repeat protein